MIYLNEKFIYESIGIIRTPFKEVDGMPIQSSFSNTKGKIVLDSKYADALLGLDGFSHLYLLYLFHRAKDLQLHVKPFLSEKKLGVFSVRAPNRPNPIGISIVRLISIDINGELVEIAIEGVDMLDQTPLLDIKPYINEFDAFIDTKNGWYDKRELKRTKSDKRFIKE